ncbi:MAG TPA: LytR C-terminal domain-containing protein, partial [Patescibacteria group bacterium]|nr:LytR C-terminal domain-containing protein [Patescibacteria group bacterium]
DLSAYSISVLNGSGISGEAASLRTQLEDAEFVVDSVGNADTSDYTRTEVFAKEGVSEAYLNTLIKELEKTYEVNSVTETLDESESVDVEIIIGSTRADN